MLTTTADISSFAHTSEVIDEVNALAVVLARVGRALINIDLALGSGPSWVAYALVMEQSVHTHAVLTGIG